jgi:hypothetical protein
MNFKSVQKKGVCFFLNQSVLMTSFFLVDGDSIVAYLVNSCGKPDSTVFHNLWTQEETLQNDLIHKSRDFWCEQLGKYFLYLPSVEVMFFFFMRQNLRNHV